MPEIYEPREDTFLILKQIKLYSQGNVLDMGTGSGVLALEAANTAEKVIGVDINEDALNYAKQKAGFKGAKNIEFHHSDLFSYFRKNPTRHRRISDRSRIGCDPNRWRPFSARPIWWEKARFFGRS